MLPTYRNNDLNLKALRMAIDVISKMYEVDEDSIFSRSRRAKHVAARAMMVKILRDTLKVSYSAIAEAIGRHKSQTMRIYKLHDKYYCLNYHGYKWDFIDISTEFSGRYFSENGRLSSQG
jgi:hypothetical protein